MSGARLWIVGAVIAVAIGFLVIQGLGSATLYFYRVDEAVAKRDELGERRIRLEGMVQAEPRSGPDGTEFEIAGESGRTVSVVHAGDPPELFQPGIPVVLEGRFEGDGFASDRIMVRHSEEYEAENPDRLAEASE
ncbi:MAG: cytochrome c maturation protein CcmE [Actinomycetota bacterium]